MTVRPDRDAVRQVLDPQAAAAADDSPASADAGADSDAPAAMAADAVRPSAPADAPAGVLPDARLAHARVCRDRASHPVGGSGFQSAAAVASSAAADVRGPDGAAVPAAPGRFWDLQRADAVSAVRCGQLTAASPDAPLVAAEQRRAPARPALRRALRRLPRRPEFPARAAQQGRARVARSDGLQPPVRPRVLVRAAAERRPVRVLRRLVRAARSARASRVQASASAPREARAVWPSSPGAGRASRAPPVSAARAHGRPFSCRRARAPARRQTTHSTAL